MSRRGDVHSFEEVAVGEHLQLFQDEQYPPLHEKVMVGVQSRTQLA